MLPLIILIAALPRIHDGPAPPAGYVTIPAPSAANGARLAKTPKVFYPAAKNTAALAAAEAYAHGTDALISPDPADRGALDKMLEYLDLIHQPALPASPTRILIPNAPSVVARLTARGTHTRLHLLNYAPQPATNLRVRVPGKFGRVQPFFKDATLGADAVEFTVPELATYMVVDLEPAKRAVSLRANADFELTADPDAPHWRSVPAVRIDRKSLNGIFAGPVSEVRSRWTPGNLYLLFSCPYDELNLKPDPQTARDTDKLWDWDVAEAFIGSEFDHHGHYREFQVSPRGEWVDLDIDRDHPKTEKGIAWNSGYKVKARVDSQRKIWYGEMRIPFDAFPVTPKPGLELRTGFYRCAGVPPKRVFAAWSPTGQRSFHGPHAFGILRLQ